MKHSILTISLFSLLLLSNIYGQTTETDQEETSKNQYSNDRIPTSINEIITNKQYKKIKGNEKIENNLLIVLKNNGELTSYDLSTLKQQWNLKFTDSSNNKMSNRFKIENAILYTTSTQKQLRAVNVNDGTTYWKTEIGLHKEKTRRYMITGQQLPIKGSLIYLASNNSQLYAFDKTNGSLSWNYKLQYPYNMETPVVNNKYLVIPNAPLVYCFEADTGKAIWAKSFGKVPMYSQMQIDNDKCYVAGTNNEIYALNLENNAPLAWKFKTEYNYPKIKENTLLENAIYYLGAKNGSNIAPSMIALDANNGTKKWETKLNNEGQEIKTFIKHKDIIVGFTDGKSNSFFIIKAATGEQIDIEIPKEKIISNIFKLDDTNVVFLTKNYLVTFNIKKRDYTYQDIKLENKVNDAFLLYFEIVKKN